MSKVSVLIRQIDPSQVYFLNNDYKFGCEKNMYYLGLITKQVSLEALFE